MEDFLAKEPSFPHIQDMSYIIYTLLCYTMSKSVILPQRRQEVYKRLFCSVTTGPLPKHAQELNMEAPKEIFLKDYKKPDYYFDTVRAFYFYLIFINRKVNTQLFLLIFHCFLIGWSTCICCFRWSWNFYWKKIRHMSFQTYLFSLLMKVLRVYLIVFPFPCTR